MKHCNAIGITIYFTAMSLIGIWVPIWLAAVQPINCSFNTKHINLQTKAIPTRPSIALSINKYPHQKRYAVFQREAVKM